MNGLPRRVVTQIWTGFLARVGPGARLEDQHLKCDGCLADHYRVGVPPRSLIESQFGSIAVNQFGRPQTMAKRHFNHNGIAMAVLVETGGLSQPLNLRLVRSLRLRDVASGRRFGARSLPAGVG